MPFLLALIAFAAAAYFWMNRARNAAHIAGDVADMAQTAMGAARRFGFRRRANVHPVDSIEDEKLAIGGLSTAFLELSGMPTTEEKRALEVGLQSSLDLSLKDAEEMVILGHWFVNECGGPQPAVTRLAKKVNKMAGAEGLSKSMDVIKRIVEAGGSELSPAQSDALAEIKSIFRLR